MGWTSIPLFGQEQNHECWMQVPGKNLFARIKQNKPRYLIIKVGENQISAEGIHYLSKA